MAGITVLFILCFVFSHHQKSYAIDTLTVTESIKDGDTITSTGESFELGFFSPDNSTNRYVGIWYKNVSVLTVVWVANRQIPLINKSGVFKLVQNPIPALIILDSIDSNNTIWSSSSSADVSKTVISNPILQLLDSGNLVLRDLNVSNSRSFYWQSFDYPVDTLLPGMKLGKNLETGFETYLSSWKTAGDPSPGDYTFHCDPTGYPQLIMKKKLIESFRVGSWNGRGFSGQPYSKPAINFDFRYTVVINETEVYYTFDLVSELNLSKLTLTPIGTAQRSTWVPQTGRWRVFFYNPVDQCDTYSFCGGYGACNIMCRCLEKFVPRDRDKWAVNEWSGGCVRVNGLDCKSDGFRKYSGLKLPDTRSSWVDKEMKLDECETACLKNCSCMAFASLNVVDGSGCLLWFGDLIDMKDLSASFQDIYVRMASSDSDYTFLKPSGSNEKKKVIIKVVLPLLMGTALLALSLIVYYWRKKKRLLIMMTEGIDESLWRRGSINKMQTDDMELQLFDLPRITNATKNFAISCKLGEGGFGPVYKGILDDGQEIAVKRLSKTSTQGIEEFKNEVLLIAKLQHRNLVKLLGYCIEDDEMILIYEFMPNNSLDSIIFDEKRRQLLDWPMRYNIINGVARGLLYLHQDSRLRIIHRDLKASNVLLDSDMNPKISDFGLARRFGGNEMGSNTRMVVGTYGYMSPEYAVHGLFSVKSDVFSFGVLLLEIVSGKKNRGFFQQDHSDNLLGHAWRLYKEGKSLDLIDATLLESFSISEALRAVQVGLLCVQHSPGDRPNMSSVVLMLSGEGILPEPKQPGFYTKDSILQAECSSSAATRISVNEVTITLLDGR